ncbi:tyrosine-type recombinase/integrase [Ectothiorhodospira sp. 9100]|uniref:tyrosine-type recombinase/integrase n=1 Tax=Ectothiorhodospira sp. 9100 TaxID=2897388 RepID=UPI003FCCC39C
MANPIADLAAPQILQVIQRIEQRGALETAHRVLGCCSQVFRYAVATRRADRDPCGDLRGALPPVRSRHFAAVTEPEQCAAVLRAIEGYQGSLIVRSALHLAPLVFVRPGELRKAEWMDFDLETAEWRYTVTKTPGIVIHPAPYASQSPAAGSPHRDGPVSRRCCRSHSCAAHPG